jgi:WD40 repeat protein
VAVGALPDGTPVIVSGGGGEDCTVRVWRLADGTPVGEPLRGHDGGLRAVAAGALPDGTPVIVSGGRGGGYRDGTVRVWRLADGTPAGEPLEAHYGPDDNRVSVAVGALPDGTPVIISGGWDRTVRVWRLADGTPVMPPLDLPESVRAVTIHGIVIVTAAGADIAVHQPRSRGPCASFCSVSRDNARPMKRPDNGRLSGTTRSSASDHVGGGPPSFARLGHVIRYIC